MVRSSPHKVGKIFLKLPTTWARYSKMTFNELVMLESKQNPRMNPKLLLGSGRSTMMASHGARSPNPNGLVQMIDDA